jgi:hypothetical protein
MDILNQLETQPIPIDEEEKRRTRRFLIGLVCALAVTGLVFGGYMFLRKRHESQVAAATQVEVQKKAAKVRVAVDEPIVNGNRTVLGGTIENISNEALQNIAVELQLRRRVGSGVETKTVTPELADLAPGAQTRYSVEVATQDYIASTFARVVGGSDRASIPFKAQPGNAAPAMESPGSKTIVVDKPRSNKKDEFINTPNNPGRVP